MVPNVLACVIMYMYTYLHPFINAYKTCCIHICLCLYVCKHKGILKRKTYLHYVFLLSILFVNMCTDDACDRSTHTEHNAQGLSSQRGIRECPHSCSVVERGLCARLRELDTALSQPEPIILYTPYPVSLYVALGRMSLLMLQRPSLTAVRNDWPKDNSQEACPYAVEFDIETVSLILKGITIHYW